MTTFYSKFHIQVPVSPVEGVACKEEDPESDMLVFIDSRPLSSSRLLPDREEAGSRLEFRQSVKWDLPRSGDPICFPPSKAIPVHFRCT